MKLDEFQSKFYLVYNNEKLDFIESFDLLKKKYNEYLKKENEESNNFLIVSEFIHTSPTTFKINNPILSFGLRKEIKDASSLCRSWRLSKKNEENLLSIGDIIKLGRVRLKIDTICLGEIYESSLITNNILKNRSKILPTNKLISNFKSNNINSNIIINNHNESSDDNNEDDRASNHREGEDDATDNKLLANNENPSEFSGSVSGKSGRPLCRICYLSNSSEDNPLIAPCKCCGSMNNIHYLCLKKCIETNITTKTEPNYKFYTWKSFCCEICKAEYPKYIRYKEFLYPLVDLDINYSSYVTCDYTLYDDAKKKIFRKGILIFKINEDVDEEIISVGRSQNNKIKLKDISVSRYHCNFIKRKNKLLIVDKGSKFGTLIYLNSPLFINLKNNEGTLISGRHWFSINLEQKKNFLSRLFPLKCCECSEIKQNTDIDVELLGIESKIQEQKIDAKNDVSGNIENYQIIDESYQDYILEVGNSIYLRQDLDLKKKK